MMTKFIAQSILAISLIGGQGVARSAQLSPEAVDAWQQYLHSADSRMQSRLAPAGHFMWIDDKPHQRMQVRDGEILIAPIAGHGSIPVPGGLIHEWIGAVFIPNATIDHLLGIVSDYNHYRDIYSPNVVESHVEQRADDHDRFSMCLVSKTTLLTAAMEVENEVQKVRVNPDHAYVTSQSSSIRQIRNYGREDQSELAPGQGDGFIWRLYSVSRYEQKDGGVYVELEAIALTRDIPGSLRWLVKPIVARMSRNSLFISLSQTRIAVSASNTNAKRRESDVMDSVKASESGSR